MQRRFLRVSVGVALAAGLGCSAESSGPRDAGQGAGAPAAGSPGAAGVPAAGGAGAQAAAGSGNASGGQNTTAGASGSSAGIAGQSDAGAPSFDGSPVVFVGGFGADPIRLYDLNKATGGLTAHGEPVDAGSMPSCLAVDPSGKHLFVCNEDGGSAGGVTAFAIAADGGLTLTNHRSGSKQGFTSLAVHPSGKLIAGADYDGGSVSAFPIGADGAVGSEAGVATFSEGAQSHCVAYDPAGKVLLVTTKGARAVQQLLSSDAGVLTANAPPSVPSESGNAPRHIAVHRNGKFAYVVNEAGSSVTTYQLSADGKLTRGATIPSIPADYQGSNTGAHIELGPGSKYLYVSNRGHDSIGVFAVDAATGALTLLEHEPSRGSAPHDFDIDPAGEVLIAANRKSATLAAFKIAADGTLSPLGEPVPTREDITAVLIHYPR